MSLHFFEKWRKFKLYGTEKTRIRLNTCDLLLHDDMITKETQTGHADYTVVCSEEIYWNAATILRLLQSGQLSVVDENGNSIRSKKLIQIILSRFVG